MDTLSTYEKVSSKLVNKQKSYVAIDPNVPVEAAARVENITEMEHKMFPIKYLGCPLYVGRKIFAIFSTMISRVLNKITGWHSKILSI